MAGISKVSSLIFKSRVIVLEEEKNQRQSLLHPWEMRRLPIRRIDAFFPPDIWRRALWCWWWEMFLACSGWMRNRCYPRLWICHVFPPNSNWYWKKSCTGREMPLSNCIRVCKEEKYHLVSIPSKSAIYLIAQLLCFLSSSYELEPFDRFKQQQWLKTPMKQAVCWKTRM